MAQEIFTHEIPTRVTHMSFGSILFFNTKETQLVQSIRNLFQTSPVLTTFDKTLSNYRRLFYLKVMYLTYFIS